MYRRVRAKLEREPIEDLRIDFEDGYGTAARRRGGRPRSRPRRALRQAVGGAPRRRSCGIRFKSFEAADPAARAPDADLFVGELTDGGGLPDGFVVTLPKVTSVDQVEAMVVVCERARDGARAAAGALRFEIQVETPQAILGADGRRWSRRMIHAARGRVHRTALRHLRLLAPPAAIAAAYQSMEHPVADHAKAVMQVAAAGTGVRLSDGSTNVLPVGDRARCTPRGGCTPGWSGGPWSAGSTRAGTCTRRSCRRRYVAVYAFYREGLPTAAARLRAYVGAERVRRSSTSRRRRAALAGFLVRAVDCGASDDAEVEKLSVRHRSGSPSWPGGSERSVLPVPYLPGWAMESMATVMASRSSGVLPGVDLDAVGVPQPEPLLGDLGDLVAVLVDLVLVVDDVALHLQVLAVARRRPSTAPAAG